MLINTRKLIFLLCFGWLALKPFNIQAENMGYLFTSAAQRETLDTVRDQYQRGSYTEGGEKINQQGYKFNGVISKQGSAKALWVNGNSASAARSKSNSRGEYRVDLPLGQVQLKPGQIYQPASANVIEAFDEGRTHEGQ